MADKETEKQGIFGKLFSVITGAPASKTEDDAKIGEHAPKEKEPEDVRFVRQFTQNGGFFLYCGTTNEIIDGLHNMIAEHNLANIGSPDPNIFSFLKSNNIPKVEANIEKCDTICTNCEALIAFNGGIMINEFHTHGLRIDEMPKYHIVFGKTSQLVENLSSAMTRVNHQYRENRPMQIAVLKGAKDPQVNLASADPNKDRTLFLLLIEDSL
jgi:L-lactate dehydrogenase complex protein LldG